MCLSENPKPLAEIEAINLVMTEVARAGAKFPTWPTDPLHALAVLGEEFGELTQAVMQAVYEPHKSGPDQVRAEAIQCAAMAIRFIQSLPVYRYAGSEQHAQLATLAADDEVRHG